MLGTLRAKAGTKSPASVEGATRVPHFHTEIQHTNTIL
jgi:hypothetical protein